MVIQFTLTVAGIIFSLIILLSLAVILLALKLRRKRFELFIWERLPEIMSPSLALEERFKAIFGLIEKVIKTDNAYVYLLESQRKKLIQRASKRGLPSEEEEADRIFEDSREEEEASIQLPRAMERLEKDDLPTLVTQGTAKFFSLPIISSKGLEGVIRFGPIFSKHMRCLRRNESLLSSLSTPFSLIIEEGLVLSKVREEVTELGALSQIEKVMMEGTLKLDTFLELLLGVAISSCEADGGLILADQLKVKKKYIQKGIPPLIMERIKDITSLEEELKDLSFIAQPFQGGIVVLIREKEKSPFLENSKKLLGLFAKQIELAFKRADSSQAMLNDYLDTLRFFVETMDTQDPFTVEHSKNIAQLADLIAHEMNLSDDEIEGIEIAAFLHDIGMSGIAEEIFKKPGKFTEYEYETMKNHAQIGACLVEPIKQPIDIAPIIRGHHERYDGWGYPDGLRGKNIPLGARIVALADTFNAKIEKRAYREPLSLEEAIKRIEDASGAQFDPEVVEAFLVGIKKTRHFLPRQEA
ncbi:TPA: hypothetical protein DCX15_05365 [bacterium]|nr:hypothetical protein [bacterium]